MSTLSIRSHRQEHNNNMRVGRPPQTVATAGEKERINQAIECLKRAKSCDNEATLLVNVSEAYRLSRDIFRQRSDL